MFLSKGSAVSNPRKTELSLRPSISKSLIDVASFSSVVVAYIDLDY